MNGLQHAGAFVVQFSAGTEFSHDRVQGRIEHVASGWTARFESTAELLELFAAGLKQAQRRRTRERS